MPITQSRLLAVIQAGETFHRIALEISRTYSALLQSHRAGTLTSDEFIVQTQFIDLPLRTDAALAAAAVLAHERGIYAATHSKNEYDRRRRAQNQGRLHTPLPRPPSQVTFIPQHTVAPLHQPDDLEDLIGVDLTFPDQPTTKLGGYQPRALDPATQAEINRAVEAELARAQPVAQPAHNQPGKPGE